MSDSSASDQWWLTWNTLTYANPDVFGPLVGANTIQEAFYQTLQRWLPAYIHEFNRCLGGDILTVPKDYRLKPDRRPMSRDVEASILVVCSGTAKRPERRSHSTRATWGVEASVCVTGGADWQQTQALTGAYGVAMRAAIVQHPDLGGVASTTLWVSDKYLEKEATSTRVIGLTVVNFEVTTENAVDVYGGPPSPEYAAALVDSEPSLNPPAPVPVAETVTTTVTNERITP